MRQAVTTLKTKFPLGDFLATPDALAALEASGQTPVDFIVRHATGDWGEVCPEDGRLNDEAIHNGSRLLSVYSTRKGAKIWLITEAVDCDGLRRATTLLLPENY